MPSENMDKEDYLPNLHYLPIIVFISLPSVFILTYILSIISGHVEPWFPYISDTATQPPESCIFAQFVNMLAVLMSFLMYIRHSQVKEWSSTFCLQESLLKWNYWSLIFGLLATFGLSIVANFQVTIARVMHFIGAFLSFGCGTVYFWTQTVCTFYLYPVGSTSLKLVRLRTALSTFCVICFVVLIITGILAHLAYKGTNPQKWCREDGGWELHVASAVTEWLFAGLFCVYFLTFVDEFRDARLIHPKFVSGLNQSSISNEALNESQDAPTIRDRHTPRIT